MRKALAVLLAIFMGSSSYGVALEAPPTPFSLKLPVGLNVVPELYAPQDKIPGAALFFPHAPYFFRRLIVAGVAMIVLVPRFAQAASPAESQEPEAPAARAQKTEPERLQIIGDQDILTRPLPNGPGESFKDLVVISRSGIQSNRSPYYKRALSILGSLAIDPSNVQQLRDAAIQNPDIYRFALPIFISYTDEKMTSAAAGVLAKIGDLNEGSELTADNVPRKSSIVELIDYMFGERFHSPLIGYASVNRAVQEIIPKSSNELRDKSLIYFISSRYNDIPSENLHEYLPVFSGVFKPIVTKEALGRLSKHPEARIRDFAILEMAYVKQLEKDAHDLAFKIDKNKIQAGDITQWHKNATSAAFGPHKFVYMPESVENEIIPTLIHVVKENPRFRLETIQVLGRLLTSGGGITNSTLEGDVIAVLESVPDHSQAAQEALKAYLKFVGSIYADFPAQFKNATEASKGILQLVDASLVAQLGTISVFIGWNEDPLELILQRGIALKNLLNINPKAARNYAANDAPAVEQAISRYETVSPKTRFRITIFLGFLFASFELFYYRSKLMGKFNKLRLWIYAMKTEREKLRIKKPLVSIFVVLAILYFRARFADGFYKWRAWFLKIKRTFQPKKPYHQPSEGEISA